MKIITPSLCLCFIFLLIQQMIVGLSTYFIANLAIDIAKNDDFLLNLAGFVLSLIIVYILYSCLFCHHFFRKIKI